MGIRGEIFSNKVMLPNRTYFFNVKENRNGDLYLNIVESKNKDSGGFDRQSVILFADDLQEFLKGFEESLKVMEKAMREKRQSGKVSSKKFSDDSKAGGAPRRSSNERSNSGERKFVKRKDSHEGRERGRREQGGFKPDRADRPNRADRSGRADRPRERDNNRGNDRGNDRTRSGDRPRGEARGRGGERSQGGTRGRGETRERSSERRLGSERKPGANKRVVVRKRD
ncbi:MAG: DUF3276 family protein [Treponema sp.]|nr:DUF3276 family protein [Treponema sp.]